jgi:membrane protein DedA with SNARE-associated domain
MQGTMEALFADLGTFIQEHQTWAGPIVLLITFGESLVIAGLLIPATALLLLVGGLVGSGVLDPVTVLACAIVGAVLGDVVSYVLGRWLGPGIVHRKPLRRYRQAVARTRLFFRRYGFAAVFLGRFLGPIRSTVPLVAGMMAMDQKRFQIANVLSAAVWAPLMLTPGWLATRGMEQLPGLSGEHMVAGLVVVLVVTAVATLMGGRRLFAKSSSRDELREARRRASAARLADLH